MKENSLDPNVFYAITEASSEAGYTSNMYINLNKSYLSGETVKNKISLVKSEFARSLILHHLKGNKNLPPIFMEGLAEYTSRSEEGETLTDFAAFYIGKNEYKNLIEVINLGFFDTEIQINNKSAKEKSFLYSVAPTIIAYLNDKHPNFIKNLLEAKTKTNFDEIIKNFEEKVDQGLESWVDSMLTPKNKVNEFYVEEKAYLEERPQQNNHKLYQRGSQNQRDLGKLKEDMSTFRSPSLTGSNGVDLYHSNTANTNKLNVIVKPSI